MNFFSKSQVSWWNWEFILFPTWKGSICEKGKSGNCQERDM